MALRRLRVAYGTKLLVGAVLLVAAVGVVVLLLIDRALRTDLMNDMDARLESRARGAAEWAAEGQHPERLAHRLSKIVGERVTILDGMGRVIGDSSGDISIGADESTEPEIVAALRGSTGRAARLASGGIETRYVAI